MDRDGHFFHALFQYLFYTWVQSHAYRVILSNMGSDARACFLSKAKYRAVIRHLYLKGKMGKKIHGELADVYGPSAPSSAYVKFKIT